MPTGRILPNAATLSAGTRRIHLWRIDPWRVHPPRVYLRRVYPRHLSRRLRGISRRHGDACQRAGQGSLTRSRYVCETTRDFDRNIPYADIAPCGTRRPYSSLRGVAPTVLQAAGGEKKGREERTPALCHRLAAASASSAGVVSVDLEFYALRPPGIIKVPACRSAAASLSLEPLWSQEGCGVPCRSKCFLRQERQLRFFPIRC